jgi:hypothetical protein
MKNHVQTKKGLNLDWIVQVCKNIEKIQPGRFGASLAKDS